MAPIIARRSPTVMPANRPVLSAVAVQVDLGLVLTMLAMRWSITNLAFSSTMVGLMAKAACVEKRVKAAAVFMVVVTERRSVKQ